MPQFERRLYDPAEEQHLFDGGEDDFEDEGSRLPLLIVIALVVLASFGGVVWLAYTQGVQRGREDAPRIIAEQTSQPPDAGSRKNPYSKLQIYRPKDIAATATGSTATPPPHQNVKPASPTSLLTPHAQLNASALHVAKAAASIPKPPAATPHTAVSPPASSAAKLPSSEQPARAAKAPRTLPSVAMPNTKPVGQPSAADATGAPAQNSAAEAPKPAAAQTSGQGGYVLQIGSYTSEAEANTSWQAYRQTHASVASYGSDIKAADLGSKGTWYRLRIGPFASLTDASSACAKLKAQGASCFPAKR